MNITVISIICWMLFHLAMSSSLPILSYSVFTTGKMHYHPHFSNKVIEAGQGEVLCRTLGSITWRQWSMQRSAWGFVFATPVSTQIITSYLRAEPSPRSVETTVTGSLLCVQCLVQIYIISVTPHQTLQSHCHCPLLTGKKTRGQWANQISLPFLPL